MTVSSDPSSLFSPVTRAVLRAQLIVDLAKSKTPMLGAIVDVASGDDQLLQNTADLLGLDVYAVECYAKAYNGKADPIQQAKINRRTSPEYVPCPKCHKSIAGCDTCSHYGVVPKVFVAKCEHTYRDQDRVRIAVSLHRYTCTKCGVSVEVDTSD